MPPPEDPFDFDAPSWPLTDEQIEFRLTALKKYPGDIGVFRDALLNWGGVLYDPGNHEVRATHKWDDPCPVEEAPESYRVLRLFAPFDLTVDLLDRIGPDEGYVLFTHKHPDEAKALVYQAGVLGYQLDGVGADFAEDYGSLVVVYRVTRLGPIPTMWDRLLEDEIDGY